MPLLASPLPNIDSRKKERISPKYLINYQKKYIYICVNSKVGREKGNVINSGKKAGLGNRLLTFIQQPVMYRVSAVLRRLFTLYSTQISGCVEQR